MWKREENVRLSLMDACKKSSVFLMPNISQVEAVGSKIIWLGLSEFMWLKVKSTFLVVYILNNMFQKYMYRNPSKN